MDQSIDTRGTNQSGMRAQNERLVLSLIWRQGPMAKADIARQTGLSAQTISVIMRELQAESLLIKEKPVRGKVGQPLVPMSLNKDGAFFFGLKIGRRSAEVVLMDLRGTVRARKRLITQFPDFDQIVAFATQAIAELTQALPAQLQARVRGLGIAMPFRLWDWAATLGVAPELMEDWRVRDIKSVLFDEFQLPVFLQNDASAACGAELAFGEGLRAPNFLHFYVGFFVGGGVVLNGKLFTGETLNAGALGSMPVVDRHNNRQQLVDVASLYTLEQSIVGGGGTASQIWDGVAAWEIDADILENWLAHAAFGLAQAILAASCVIDFEATVVEGWLPDTVKARLVELTSNELAALNHLGIGLPRVEAGNVGAEARTIGAALLPLAERYLAQ